VEEPKNLNQGGGGKKRGGLLTRGVMPRGKVEPPMIRGAGVRRGDEPAGKRGKVKAKKNPPRWGVERFPMSSSEINPESGMHRASEGYTSLVGEAAMRSRKGKISEGRAEMKGGNARGKENDRGEVDD